MCCLPPASHADEGHVGGSGSLTPSTSIGDADPTSSVDFTMLVLFVPPTSMCSRRESRAAQRQHSVMLLQLQHRSAADSQQGGMPHALEYRMSYTCSGSACGTTGRIGWLLRIVS